MTRCQRRNPGGPRSWRRYAGTRRGRVPAVPDAARRRPARATIWEELPGSMQ